MQRTAQLAGSCVALGIVGATIVLMPPEAIHSLPPSARGLLWLQELGIFGLGLFVPWLRS